MDAHELAEERSLAYHARVADLLRTDPSGLDRIRARVNGWVTAGWPHPYYASAWREILEGSVDRICTLLLDRGERARALRQVTPFAGFLNPRERWAIWRNVREKFGE